MYVVRLTGIVVLALMLLTSAASTARCQPVTSQVADAPRPRSVLIIYSYLPTKGYTQQQQRAFQHVFGSEMPRDPKRLELYEEVLGADNPMSADAERNMAKLLQARYRSKDLSVVILADTPALEFYDRWWSELMPDVPVVFSAACQVPLGMRDGSRPVTGIVERYSVTETLSLIRRVHPEVRKILVVAGRIAPELRFAIGEAAVMGQIELDLLEGLTGEQTLDRLASVADDEAVLWISFPDPGLGISVSHFLSVISDLRRPTYCLYEAQIGNGAIGGVVAAGSRYAAVAASMARRILSGQDPHDIPIHWVGVNAPIFDHRQLERWGIDHASLPSGSEVRFMPESWISLHWRELRAGFVTMAIGLPLALAVGVMWRHERRLAHELRDREAKLRAITENIPGHVFRASLSVDGIFRREYLSEGYEHVFGGPPPPLERPFDSVDPRFLPEDEPKVREALRESARTLSPIDLTARVYTSAGDIRWIHFRSTPHARDDGAVVWDGVAVDESDAHRAEQRLRDSEARLRALCDTAPCAMYSSIKFADGRRRLEYAGPGLEALLGDELAAKVRENLDLWFEMVPPPHRGKIQQLTEEVARSGGTYSHDYPLVTPQGRTIWVRVLSACEPQPDGSRRWHGVMTDITDEIRTRHELDEKRRTLELVTENMPGFIYRCSVTPDEILIPELISVGYRRIFGVDPVFNARPLAQHNPRYHPEEQMETVDAMRESIRTLKPLERVVRALRPDGSSAWIHIRASVSRRENGEAVFDGVVVDVTDLKRAEQALRREQERLSLVFQATNDVVWSWDLNERTIEWSNSLTTIFGIQLSNLVTGENFCLEQIHPEDRERVRASIRHVVDSGARTWKDTYRFRRGDGSYADVIDRGSIIRDESGRAQRMIGALSDITELRRASEQLRLALLAGDMATWKWDLELGVFTHSEEFARMFNLPPSTGPTHHDILINEVIPEDRSIISAALEQANTSDDGKFHCEYRVRDPGGSPRWLMCSGRRSRREPDDRPTLFGVTMDITRRKLAEESLIESEARFRAITDNAEEVLWIWDLEARRAEYASSAFEAIWGGPWTDICSSIERFLETILPEDRPLVIEGFAGLAQGCDVTFRVVRPDGQIRWVRARGYPIRGEGGRVTRVAGVSADVTEAHRNAEAIRRGEAQLADIIDQTGVIAWEYDPVAESFTHVVGQPESLLGYTVEEWKTRRFWQEHLHQEDREGVINYCEARSLVGEHHNIEYRFRAADGRYVWLRDYVQVRSENGGSLFLGGIMIDITGLKQVESDLRRTAEAQKLLLSELDHRVKNSLASLLSLIDLFSKTSVSATDFARAMRERVQAMAVVHTVLSQTGWEPIPVHLLLDKLIPVELRGCISISGPPLEIPARQATALAMVFQELFTNTLKHGVCGSSNSSLPLVIEWRTMPRSDMNRGSPVQIVWTEPRPAAEHLSNPTPRTGTRLIEGFAKFELCGNVRFEFGLTQICHTLDIEIDDTSPTLPVVPAQGVYPKVRIAALESRLESLAW